MNIRALVTVFVLGLIPHFADAEVIDAIQTGRYTSYALEPSQSLTNPLQVVIDVKLPTKMNYVGEAVEYLLQRSGYQTPKNSADIPPEMYVLFSRTIPAQQRNMGTIRLNQALAVLAGDAYELRVNQITREISFGIKDGYSSSLAGIDMIQFKKLWDERLSFNTTSELKVEDVREGKSLTLTTDTRVDNSDEGATYGPVAKGETLGAIAKMFVSDKATDSMVMVSIFNNNPEAFINGNMNTLKAGVNLKIPPRETLDSISKSTSEQITNQHYAAYLEYLSHE